MSSTALHRAVGVPVGSAITDQDVLRQLVKQFKDCRSLARTVFAQNGLQPCTGPQEESDEENLRRKRLAYVWKLRPDFVPQVDCKAMNREGKTLLQSHEILNIVRLAGFGNTTIVPDAQTVNSMEAIEIHNRVSYEDSDIGAFFNEPNVGLRPDWFTDAVFAQQQFTGVNPTSITVLSDPSIFHHFVAAANAQGNAEVDQIMKAFFPLKQLYVQDSSYFRGAVGLGPDQAIVSEHDSNTDPRYGCASMVLFTLDQTGKLHPLAITIDYIGTESGRITIFNKRLNPDDSTHDEASDWPWRYAKMCAQVSDWSHHEMAVHLTNTHIIQEAFIVAAQRHMPDSHIILQTLNSHWQTTLSINALATTILVPNMIHPVSPFTLPQVIKFLQQARAEFDFEGSYVPADLERRGFPVSELENPTGKFHNYTYGRQVYKMWEVTRKFVASILTESYADDAAVAADTFLSGFIEEIRAGDGVTTGGGNLPTFPIVSTLDSLVDMVTMIIHIGAPEHSAVNYLQHFYLAYIPNRPASLCTPLPKSLAELQNYGEQDILAALPLKNPTNWLMMAQVPYLLSEEVEMEDNIISFAVNSAKSVNAHIAQAGAVLAQDITVLAREFKISSAQNDDKVTEYRVMYPDLMAAAIII